MQPSPHENELQEAWRLSRQIIEVADRAKADFAKIVNDIGITVPMARALALLEKPQPMSVLAENLACDRSYITSIADQLEASGLARRVQGQDRRIRQLALTDEGRNLRDEIAYVVSAESMILRLLGPDQRVLLGEVLQLLLHPTDTDD